MESGGISGNQCSFASVGTVYLVGAGPGDPGAVTLRAVECLGRADVVLYDYLVNPAIVRHARPGAELVCLGHHSRGRQFSQEEINARMIAAARQGKTVVRLKAGDPMVFGHGAEEIEALRAAGIPFEIVPGITVGLAVADYAEIPITHGEHSSAVALVTGHERRAKGRPLDYAALATFPGTLVFYMGVSSAADWSQALIEGGKSPDTPVAIVRRCSCPDQRTVYCTLGTVAETLAREKLRPPAVIVVGHVAGLAAPLSWFGARPLAGVCVLVTRPSVSGTLRVPPDLAGTRRVPENGGTSSHPTPSTLEHHLSELGAQILFQPAVLLSAPPDWSPVDTALARLDQYDWLVFSSANGVRYLIERLFQLGGDLRQLGRIKLAAIGPGTAAELARYHLKADLMPDEYRAESLAAALAGGAAGRRFLLARTNRGRQVLPEQLTAAGGLVEQIVVYATTEVERPDPAVAAALAAGEVDWVTVTSSAIARSLVALFGDDLRRTRLASISPITSGVLRELGYPPAAEAGEYTMAGLVATIVAVASTRAQD